MLWFSQAFLKASLAWLGLGFVLRAQGQVAGTAVLATGGTLSALGAYTFIWLIWRTIDGPRGLRNAVAAASQATEGPRALRVQQ